jgi:predicted amidohydrolase YtcJ
VEKDGKIIFTGDQLPEVYARVEPVDLKNRCVVPAFADTHMHFASFAFFNSGLDCRGVHDFAELDELVRKYIALGKKEKVILGFGCSSHTVKEKKLPASILAEAGFDAATGWFYLNAFYRAINSITQSVSVTSVFKNMIAGSDYLARKGIALVHTAEGVGFPLDMDVDMVRFANRGLPQKFHIFFQTMNIKKVLRRKMPCIGGCFATALDGCFGSEDAALKEPYSHNPGSSGTLFYSQQQVNDFVKAANRSGLQVAMHTSACARLSFDENKRGTLVDGKLADFVVLDQNPLKIPVQKLNDVKIEALYLKGEKYTGQENRGSAGLFLDSLKNAYPS